jgi:hypothetical protein
MSVAYFIVLEREVPGLDPLVNGKAVGRASETALTKLCTALNVTPLADFVSHDPEELASFLEDAGIDPPADLPAEQWFDAATGLATVRALRKHLVDDPKALKNATAILRDLKEFEAVLERAQKANVRWHLAVDF